MGKGGFGGLGGFGGIGSGGYQDYKLSGSDKNSWSGDASLLRVIFVYGIFLTLVILAIGSPILVIWCLFDYGTEDIFSELGMLLGVCILEIQLLLQWVIRSVRKKFAKRDAEKNKREGIFAGEDGIQTILILAVLFGSLGLAVLDLQWIVPVFFVDGLWFIIRES